MGCLKCHNFIGVKFSEQFVLYNKNIQKRNLDLNISLFSLKQDQFFFFKSEIDNLNKQLEMKIKLNFEEVLLKKSEMDDLKITKEIDGAILIHKNQGMLIWPNSDN